MATESTTESRRRDAEVSACCGTPSSATVANVDRPAPDHAAASPCCGTTAEADASGSCCGSNAKHQAVRSGAGCCS